MKIQYKCDKRRKKEKCVQPIIVCEDGVEFRGPWTSAREAKFLAVSLVSGTHDFSEEWGSETFAPGEYMDIINSLED